MDVMLPDGTTLTNLPPDITREQLIEKLQRNGYDTVKLGLMTREQEEYARMGRAAAERGGVLTGPALTRQSMQEEAATRTGPERFLAGAGGRFDRAAYALKKLTGALTPQEQNRSLYGQEMQRTPEGRWGGALANMAMTGPAFTAGGAGLAAAGLSGVLPQAAGAGAIGAVSGALLEPENRAQASLAQGLGAATGSTIAGGMAGLARPAAGSAAQALQTEGVRLTPGQALGGTVKRLEDASKVVLDPSISQAQARASGDYFKTLLNKATAGTGGSPVTRTGQEGLMQAGERFSRAYDRLESVPLIVRPASTSAAIDGIVKQAKGDVVDTGALGRVSSSVQNLVNRPKLTFGALRTKSRDLNAMAGKVDDPALARAYRAMSDELDDMRAASGAADPKLDLGYAQFKRLEDAAAGAMSTGGVPSVGQLSQAIRRGSTTSQRARGMALLQKDIEQARGVLGETIPPMGPGTAEKLMLGAGIPAAAAYALNHPGMAALILGGVGAGKAAYTPIGAQFLTGGYPWQRAMAPMAGAAGGAAGGALAGMEPAQDTASRLGALVQALKRK